MNKSETKDVMERIEKKLKGQKSVCYMEHQNKPAWDVLNELYSSGHGLFEFNLKRYEISYHPSKPSAGNTSTTPAFEVKLYKPETIFDVDAVLAKKEITVRSFHGGVQEGYENPIQLINNDTVIGVVEDIYEDTDLNIMIQRHDTGDVTIWTDTKRFTTR